MSSIWNKVVVLGLAAVLSSPVFAADDAAKDAQDQAQAGVASQMNSAAVSSDTTEVKKEEVKKETKKVCKHKPRHGHKATKKDVADASDKAKVDGTDNADANSVASATAAAK